VSSRVFEQFLSYIHLYTLDYTVSSLMSTSMAVDHIWAWSCYNIDSWHTCSCFDLDFDTLMLC